MSTEAQKPLHLFYCYARKDRAFRDELDNHLTPLRRRNLINSWSDLEILPGTRWKAEISARLDAAHIILLLVSSDFMASDYCYSVEMERALERHNAGTVRVIPIILRPIDWHDAPFSSLQVLPTDAKPVSTWPDRDAAFYDITQGIRRVVAELRVLLEIQEWFDKGKELHQRGKYEEAIVAFDHIIRLKSDDADAYYWKGRALFNLERYEEVIVTFDHVIRLHPDSTDAYYWKGRALFDLKRYEEAIDASDHIIRLHPDSIDAYYWKGRALFDLKRYEEAIDASDHIIRLQPDSIDAYYWKGRALFDLERYEEAIDASDHIIRLQPNYAYTYATKGQTLLKLQRYEEALTSYNQAISLDPKNSSYYRAKAEVHEALAHQAREKAQELDSPKSALETRSPFIL